MNNFVCVYQTFDTIEANLIKSHLEEENIFCVLQTNDASGVLPHLGAAMGGVQLFVHKDNLEKSEKLLEQMFEEE